MGFPLAIINLSFFYNKSGVIHDKDTLGSCLSPTDIASIQGFVRFMMSDWLIPELQKRLFALNSQIAATKKGLKNVLKSWLRKPKEKTEIEGDTIYSHASIESQVRMLADLAFQQQVFYNNKKE